MIDGYLLIWMLSCKEVLKQKLSVFLAISISSPTNQPSQKHRPTDKIFEQEQKMEGTGGSKAMDSPSFPKQHNEYFFNDHSSHCSFAKLGSYVDSHVPVRLTVVTVANLWPYRGELILIKIKMLFLLYIFFSMRDNNVLFLNVYIKKK